MSASDAVELLLAHSNVAAPSRRRHETHGEFLAITDSVAGSGHDVQPPIANRASHPSMNAPTEFHYFPRLPNELKHQIWEEALLDLPSFALDPDTLQPCDYSTLENPILPGMNTNVGNATRCLPCDSPPFVRPWLPALLEVFPEVQTLARRGGMLWDNLIRSDPNRTHWFNPAKDVLFFSPQQLIKMGAHNITPRHPLRDLLATAQRIAVLYESLADGTAFMTLADPGRFPEIQRVIATPSGPGLKGLVVSGMTPTSAREATGYPDLVFIPPGRKAWCPIWDAPTRARFHVEIYGESSETLTADPYTGSAFEVSWTAARYWISRLRFILPEPELADRQPGVMKMIIDTYRASQAGHTRFNFFHSHLKPGCPHRLEYVTITA